MLKRPRCPRVDQDGLRAWLSAEPRFALGVMGFAGSWRRSGLRGPALERLIEDARLALRRALLDAFREHRERLVVVSGATDAGVLQLTYALCAEHGILAIGLAPRQVLRHRTAPMTLLALHGARFGDESALFVQVCDAFLVLGGGAQSEQEARMAREAGKPVTLIRGFGGAADLLAEEGLDGARVVDGL
ncbi:MAG: hypothetical protein H6741_27750 [Alphaproteobacteria bacterium]|nr:hypothetical protein [Alphaproteobacteria bacterium]MCB9796509.1 hypothetical protein [Alphaproteobacteria bacterium]